MGNALRKFWAGDVDIGILPVRLRQIKDDATAPGDGEGVTAAVAK